MVASVLSFFQKEAEENKELAEAEHGLVHQLLRLDLNSGEDKEAMMEALLQKEQEKLSFEEREKAAFDVHGLSTGAARVSRSNNHRSGPSLVEQTKLVELDAELIQLGVDTIRKNPLIQSEAYRLSFLRCDDMNVKVAAQRIRKNLQIKKELFGEAGNILHRELEYSDLTPQDIQVLESGMHHVSPHRDSAGRVVVLIRPQLKPKHASANAYCRASYFYHMRQMNIHQFQDVVIVVLVTRVPNPNVPRDTMELQERMMHRRVRTAMPKKAAAIHCCVANVNDDANDAVGDTLQRMFFKAKQMMMGERHRNRFRKHCGSRELIESQLGAFGITIGPDDWPNITAVDSVSNVSANPDPTCTPATMATFESSEASGTTASNSGSSSHTTTTPTAEHCTRAASCVIPNDNDVLFGRGKHTRNHAGNLYAMQLVSLNRCEYDKARKFEKTTIAKRIVETIVKTDGRFLKYESLRDGWVQVDSQTARNKISHLFRNTRASNKKLPVPMRSSCQSRPADNPPTAESPS